MTDPYLWPLLADDLSNLPPVYILVAEYDPIRDEGIWFANRLKRAGNVVLYDYYPDGFHGMISFRDSPMKIDTALRAIDNTKAFIRRILKNTKK